MRCCDVDAATETEGVAAREVAGFVGSITTSVCYLLFLLWAFAPEAALRAAGVAYYPAKWWALAAPSWLCVCVLYGYTAYESLNLMAVVKPASLRSVTDPAAVVAGGGSDAGAGAAAAAGVVPPVGDVPLSAVCAQLYGTHARACPRDDGTENTSSVS